MILSKEEQKEDKKRRYSFGPSAGGDGSGGEYTEEIQNFLRLGRDIINRKGRLSPGDIVWVKNKKEHGIIIGEFPTTIAHRCADGSKYTESSSEKYIVLTAWREEQDDDNPLSFRIRYSTISDIDLIERGSGRVGSEVLDYCKNQCLFYPNCDERCALKDLFNGVKVKKE